MRCIKGPICHHEGELSDLVHGFRADRLVQIISAQIKLDSCEYVLGFPVGWCWLLLFMRDRPVPPM